MAYDGGYGGYQRSYGGPAPPQRSATAQFDGGSRQQYGAPQQYDEYQNGYGYDDYNGGNNGAYGQDYGGQYQDQGYGRGPPQQRDPYAPGPGRGRPMPGGRGGGPIQRSMTADPHRGAQYPPRGGMGPGPGRGGPAGRGGMRPAPYASNSDPAGKFSVNTRSRMII